MALQTAERAAMVASLHSAAIPVSGTAHHRIALSDRAWPSSARAPHRARFVPRPARRRPPSHRYMSRPEFVVSSRSSSLATAGFNNHHRGPMHLSKIVTSRLNFTITHPLQEGLGSPGPCLRRWLWPRLAKRNCLSRGRKSMAVRNASGTRFGREFQAPAAPEAGDARNHR